MARHLRDSVYYRFALYIFLRNIRLFEPFLIIFFRSIGLPFFHIGTLYSIKEMVVLTMGIPSGILADVFGRKRMLILSTISYLASFVLFFLGRGFLQFAFAMGLYGLAEALMSGGYNALVIGYLQSRGLEKYRVEYLGGVRAWGQMGLALNGLLSGIFLLFVPDYRLLFAFTFIPHFINLINISLFPSVEEKPKKRGSGIDVGFLKKWDYIKVLLNSSLYMALFRTVKDYVQPILKRFALSLPVLLFLSGEQRTAIVVGSAYFLIYTMNSIASSRAYRLKRFGRDALVINGTYILGALSVVGAGILYSLGMYIYSFLIFLGMFLMLNLRRPFMLSYISSLIPQDSLATGLSIENNLKIVVAMVLAPVLGYMADALGVGNALALLGGLFLLLFPLIRVR